MANLDVKEFLEETQQDHTGDTNYATVMTVAASEWIANAKYFVVCTARVGGSNGNTVTGWKLNQATSGDIAQSESIFENAAGQPIAAPHSYNWWGIYTVPSTPEDVRLQHKTFASADDVHTDAVSLIKVRLDADLTENTDWRVASNNSLTSLTTSFVTFADTGVFTPGTPADHRLILATIRIAADSRVVNHEFKLQQDIDGAGFTDIGGIGSIEGEDPLDTKLYVWGWVDDSGSSGTRQYRIQARNDSGTANDHIYSAIFVLEANAFESHIEDLLTAPLTADENRQVLNSVDPYAPASTGDHLVFTNALVNPDGNHQWSKSFEIDDVDVDADFGAANSGRRWDPSDQHPSFRARLLSIDSGGDKLEHTGTINNTDGKWEDRFLWASSVALAAGGAQTIAVGTLAQTDSPVTASPEKIATIGTLVGIDSLLTVGPGRGFSVGVLSGTDNLLTVQPRKVVRLGTLAESESLISVGVSIFRTIGTLSELETLLAIQARKIANIGTFAEIETLLAIQARKIVNIGTFAGIESLVTIQVVQPSGQEIAVTTLAGVDSLIAIQARKIANVGTLAELEALISVGVSIFRTIGTLSELESLLSVTGLKTADIGTLAEFESLLAIQALKIATIGTLGEADSLLSIQARKIATIGTLTEIDTLIAIAAVIGGDQTIPVGVLTELDLLLNISGIKTALIGTLSEAETLLTVQARKIANIGILGELDSLIAADPVKPIITSVGSLGQFDLLRPIIGIKGVPVGTMAELEALLAIPADKPIITAVGTLAEIETLLALTGAKIVTMGTLAELETLLAISGLKTADVGTMIELESLLSIAAVKPIITPVGTLAETEVLVAVAVILGVPVLFVMAVDAIGKRSIVSAIEYDPNQTATVEGEIV